MLAYSLKKKQNLNWYFLPKPTERAPIENKLATQVRQTSKDQAQANLQKLILVWKSTKYEEAAPGKLLNNRGSLNINGLQH